MPIRHGFIASSVALAPTVSLSAASNFNESIATLNATVSANFYSTTVKFQYNTTNNFASFIEVNAATTPITGQSVSSYANITGLSVGTTYYFRCVATNPIGTTTSSVLSFTTWSLKTYLNTTAGSWSLSIPSVTPTGGSAIAPTIYEMLLYGGGGGANYSGGGGGGYRLAASHTSSTTGTQTVSGSVGGGGAAGNGGGGTGSATAGGSTTLTVGSTTWTGGGGGAGQHPGSCGSGCGGRGGTVGSGTNGANIGGCTTYGYTYTYISGYNQWTDPSCGCCGGLDKFGNCTTFCTCNNPNSPIYSTATDCGYYAGGGGGGTDGAGANAATQGSASHVGGAGGTGGGAYGLRGGNGGGGQGTQGNGAAGGFSVGSGTIVGTGGSVFNAGSAGGITFKYYGP